MPAVNSFSYFCSVNTLLEIRQSTYRGASIETAVLSILEGLLTKSDQNFVPVLALIRGVTRPKLFVVFLSSLSFFLSSSAFSYFLLLLFFFILFLLLASFWSGKYPSARKRATSPLMGLSATFDTLDHSILSV